MKITIDTSELEKAFGLGALEAFKERLVELEGRAEITTARLVQNLSQLEGLNKEIEEDDKRIGQLETFKKWVIAGHEDHDRKFVEVDRRLAKLELDADEVKNHKGRIDDHETAIGHHSTSILIHTKRMCAVDSSLRELCESRVELEKSIKEVDERMAKLEERVRDGLNGLKDWVELTFERKCRETAKP